jgi:hypothetical protein
MAWFGRERNGRYGAIGAGNLPFYRRLVICGFDPASLKGSSSGNPGTCCSTLPRAGGFAHVPIRANSNRVPKADEVEIGEQTATPATIRLVRESFRRSQRTIALK